MTIWFRCEHCHVFIHDRDKFIIHKSKHNDHTEKEENEGKVPIALFSINSRIVRIENMSEDHCSTLYVPKIRLCSLEESVQWNKIKIRQPSVTLERLNAHKTIGSVDASGSQNKDHSKACLFCHELNCSAVHSIMEYKEGFGIVFKCFRCSSTFPRSALLMEHLKTCDAIAEAEPEESDQSSLDGEVDSSAQEMDKNEDKGKLEGKMRKISKNEIEERKYEENGANNNNQTNMSELGGVKNKVAEIKLFNPTKEKKIQDRSSTDMKTEDNTTHDTVTEMETEGINTEETETAEKPYETEEIKTRETQSEVKIHETEGNKPRETETKQNKTGETKEIKTPEAEMEIDDDEIQIIFPLPSVRTEPTSPIKDLPRLPSDLVINIATPDGDKDPPKEAIPVQEPVVTCQRVWLVPSPDVVIIPPTARVQPRVLAPNESAVNFDQGQWQLEGQRQRQSFLETAASPQLLGNVMESAYSVGVGYNGYFLREGEGHRVVRRRNSNCYLCQIHFPDIQSLQEHLNHDCLPTHQLRQQALIRSASEGPAASEILESIVDEVVSSLPFRVGVPVQGAVPLQLGVSLQDAPEPPLLPTGHRSPPRVSVPYSYDQLHVDPQVENEGPTSTVMWSARPALESYLNGRIRHHFSTSLASQPSYASQSPVASHPSHASQLLHTSQQLHGLQSSHASHPSQESHSARALQPYVNVGPPPQELIPGRLEDQQSFSGYDAIMQPVPIYGYRDQHAFEDGAGSVAVSARPQQCRNAPSHSRSCSRDPSQQSSTDIVWETFLRNMLNEGNQRQPAEVSRDSAIAQPQAQTKPLQRVPVGYVQIPKESYANSLPKLFVCSLCQAKFTDTNDFKNHMINSHEMPNLTMRLLPEESKPNLPSAIDPVMVEYGISCSTCSKLFKTETALKRHITMTHKKHNYVCHNCPRSFSTADLLRRHQLRFCYKDLEVDHSRESASPTEILGP